MEYEETASRGDDQKPRKFMHPALNIVLQNHELEKGKLRVEDILSYSRKYKLQFSAEEYRWRLNCLMKCIVFVQDVSQTTLSDDILSDPIYSFIFKDKELASYRRILCGSFAEGISLFQNCHYKEAYEDLSFSRRQDVDVMYEINDIPAYSSRLLDPDGGNKAGSLMTVDQPHKLYVKLFEFIDIPDRNGKAGGSWVRVAASSILLQALWSLHPSAENITRNSMVESRRSGLPSERTAKITTDNTGDFRCDCMWTYGSWSRDFNKYGDVCYNCRSKTGKEINNKGVISTARVEEVKCEGPSVNIVYYVKNDSKRFIKHSLVSEKGVTSLRVDHVLAVKCQGWPSSASQFVTRTRGSGWPSEQLIDDIIQTGYHIVPKSSCEEPDTLYKLQCNALNDFMIDWRLSFSVAETKLFHSLNHSQVRCFLLFRAVVESLKHSSVLRTYHLKTVMLWTCEGIPRSEWTDETMDLCLLKLIDSLMQNLLVLHLPHYFVGTNLFEGFPSDDMLKLHAELSGTQEDLLSFFVSILQVQNIRFDVLLQDKKNPLRRSILNVLKEIEGGTRKFTSEVSKHLQHINRFILRNGNIWGFGINEERSKYYWNESRRLVSILYYCPNFR